MIRLIDEHRDQFGVELICRVLRPAVRGFITSRGYRAAKTRPPSARRLSDDLLVPEVARLHAENDGVYGRRKMHALMSRQGWDIGRDQTERLMRAAGVRGVKRSKKVFTTKRDPAAPLPADLVQRRFTAAAPRRRLPTSPTSPRGQGSPTSRSSPTCSAGGSWDGTSPRL
jgi:putative transposase